MPMGVVAIDGGDLPLGGGLLALLRPALALLQPGGQVALISSAPAVAQDLPAWCRVEHHDYLGAETIVWGVWEGDLEWETEARSGCVEAARVSVVVRRGEPTAVSLSSRRFAAGGAC